MVGVSVMSEIKRVYLSKQVLESIIKYIQDNNLQVDDRLPTEGRFAELFQVSRTSVREAIKALSINGAVESIPGRGTFIRAPISDVVLKSDGSLDRVIRAQTSISEIMEVRTSLELLAGNLAIERASDEGIALVADAMEQLREAVRKGSPWAPPGTLFHERMAELSGNSFLMETIKSLSEAVNRHKNSLTAAGTNMEVHLEEHEAMLDALKKRDKKALQKAIRTHMNTTRIGLLKLVDERSADSLISE